MLELLNQLKLALKNKEEFSSEEDSLLEQILSSVNQIKGEISIRWSTGDVESVVVDGVIDRSTKKGEKLSFEEVVFVPTDFDRLFEILQETESNHDAGIGINWDQIRFALDGEDEFVDEVMNRSLLVRHFKTLEDNLKGFLKSLTVVNPDKRRFDLLIIEAPVRHTEEEWTELFKALQITPAEANYMEHRFEIGLDSEAEENAFITALSYFKDSE
jgi:hypothetical protein